MPFTNTITTMLSGRPACVSYKAAYNVGACCWVLEPLSMIVGGVDMMAVVSRAEYEIACDACEVDLYANVKIDRSCWLGVALEVERAL